MGDAEPARRRWSRRLGVAGYLCLVAPFAVAWLLWLLRGTDKLYLPRWAETVFVAILFSGLPLLLVGWFIGRSLPAEAPAPSHRATRLRADAAITPAYRAAWIYVASMSALGFFNDQVPRGARPVLLLVLSLLAWVVASSTLGPVVTAGVDGLSIRYLLRRRFVAWAEIAEVTVNAGVVSATLVNGRRLWLDGIVGNASESVATLHAGVEAARVAAMGDVPRELPTGRAGRSVARWREAMNSLLAGPTYRANALHADELAAALTAGRTSADVRIGAALALVAVDPERHATGVRIAAEAVADERVRVALERIADGTVDEPTLRRATR